METPFIPSGNPETSPLKIELTNKKLFFVKTAVIFLATYAFIPIMALHNDGHLTSLTYAVILVALHIAFLAIYVWRVKFRELDPNNASLAARILGLITCVGLLALVAGQLEDDLGRLAIELMGLCAVHTLILGLLMTRCRRAHVTPDPELPKDTIFI